MGGAPSTKDDFEGVQARPSCCGRESQVGLNNNLAGRTSETHSEFYPVSDSRFLCFVVYKKARTSLDSSTTSRRGKTLLLNGLFMVREVGKLCGTPIICFHQVLHTRRRANRDTVTLS